jgi:hypothetical protein
LKRDYLGKSRNLRIDRIVYILVTKMTPDYRWEAMRVFYGFARVTLKEHEIKKKDTADRINATEAETMITDGDPMVSFLYSI